MNNENDKRVRKVSRQSWTPNRFLQVSKGIWTGIYSALKIAVGAAATVVLIGIVCLFAFIGLLATYLETDIMPNSDVTLEGFEQNGNSMVYYVDSNGDIQILQKLYADVSKDWAYYDEIPEDLIHAAVAIEDKRFFEHQGVDWIPTVKACVNMFVGSHSQFGGSSITQQLIKNLFLEQDDSADDVTVQRKVQEIFRATQFEKKYGKEVVLEWYLNKIYLGERCKGVKSAAATYFGKELEHLTAAECASLISITNNPSRFNPYRTVLDREGKTGMEQNRIRQVNTLHEMRKQGWLTEEEYEEAYNQEIVLKRGIDDGDRVADCPNDSCKYHGKVSTFEKRSDGEYYCPVCGAKTSIGENASQNVYSWFVDTLLEDVAQMMCEESGLEWNKTTKDDFKRLVCQGGYHIYSTLDLKAQQAVDKIYTDLSQIPKTQSMQQLESGIVMIDNKTGDIVAMAGGVGEKKIFDAHSCATDAKLQPGSSMKPLAVYGPAFELGVINPATVVKDLPLFYNDKNPFPKNVDRKYSYSRTILDGLVHSVNGAAISTLDMIGLEYSFKFAKDKFGLSTLVESYTNSNGKVFSDIGWSPLGMGAPTIGISVRDMSNAYSAIANKGVYREARTFTKVYDNDGRVVLHNEQDSNRILSEKSANYLTYCLDNAVDHGTGRAADLKNIGIDVAGKTGTTDAGKDKWFCGYTGRYTAAVWCGYRNPEVIKLVGSNGNPACMLWKKVMEPLHKGTENLPIYDKTGMVQVEVCKDSGKLATEACKLDARTHDHGLSRVETVWVYPEDAPKESCDSHVIVDFCETCNCAANDHCKKLAQFGLATLSKRSLVKMTPQDVQAIADAGRCGLTGQYLSDNYIYLVDKQGNPLNYTGIYGNKNQGVNAPYLVCTKHTGGFDWGDHPATKPTETTPKD